MLIEAFDCDFGLRLFPAGVPVVTQKSSPLRRRRLSAATTVENKSIEKCTFYNKKVETNSISFFFFYEYKVSCKYVQSVELALCSRKHFTDETRNIHLSGLKEPVSRGGPK